MRLLNENEIDQVAGGQDIVVTSTYIFPDPSVSGPNRIMVAQALGGQAYERNHSAHAVNNSTNTSPEVTKALQSISDLMRNATSSEMFQPRDTELPDGSKLTAQQTVDFLSRLQFEAVDKVFGNGRAGANTIGPDGIIHVQINVNDLLGYAALGQAGLDYLIFHEMAHDTAGGRAVDAAAWNAYLQEPSVSAMSDDDKNKYYPNSQEFVHNEAWANSAGMAIAQRLNAPYLTNPTNGFLTPLH